jgi:hypothetical protein
MTKKIPGFKDENGIYTSEPRKAAEPDRPTPNLSLDEIGKLVITALDRAVQHLLKKVTAGEVDRDVVGALKDCSMMLKDLKKDERDFLDSLTDEQLNEYNIK